MSIWLCSVAAIAAHPASKVEFRFDKRLSQLTIEFEHKVKNPEEHFINELQVELNDSLIVDQRLLRQDTDITSELIYKIAGAKVGDKFTVKTTCNKGGKKSASYKID